MKMNERGINEQYNIILHYCNDYYINRINREIKMNCPKCKSRTVVIDSRNRLEFQYRRHKCPVCGEKFGTREYYEKDIKPKPVCKMDCFNCPFPDCIK